MPVLSDNVFFKSNFLLSLLISKDWHKKSQRFFGFWYLVSSAYRLGLIDIVTMYIMRSISSSSASYSKDSAFLPISTCLEDEEAPGNLKKRVQNFSRFAIQVIEYFHMWKLDDPASLASSGRILSFVLSWLLATKLAYWKWYTIDLNCY